uniref:Uncharacterized protein n=1 Tax=Kalanchoe fedtschenkoi TaxID=63787 RepID=A0A7N0TZF1_KALFE
MSNKKIGSLGFIYGNLGQKNWIEVGIGGTVGAWTIATDMSNREIGSLGFSYGILE